MYKIVSLLFWLAIVSATCFSQTNPAKKPANKTSQKEVQDMMKEAQKMMEEAMKDMSPEEKKMMEEAMKSVKDMQASGKLPVAGSEVKTTIPAKQTALLASLPNIKSSEQYTSYLAGLKTKASRKVAQNIKQEVEKLIAGYSTNPVALNNLPPSLFLQKKPVAAVYAAILIAQINKTTLLSQNNLAAILHQTGYPQYALPMLEYHVKQTPSAILYNNAGQCYLTLGEKRKAEEYFMACIKIDPGHAEAHCGIALIKIDEGKTPEAIPHIQQAMKNGYSPALDKLVETKKISLDYDALKTRAPEYFNPNKYKPVPPAYKLSDVKTVLTQRNELKLLVEEWNKKENEIYEEQTAKMEKENLLQMSSRIQGLFPTAPFGKKAKFMILQNAKAMYEWAVQTAMDDYNNSVETDRMHDALEKRIGERQGAEQLENAYEQCVMQAEESNKYLQTSAEFYDGIIRKSLHKYYDFANQQLYWYRFLVNEDQYKTIFYPVAADLIEKLESYSKFQRLGRPDYVVIHCEKILQNPPKAQVITEQPDANCPVKMKIPLGIGSVKMDCKGWEIEGGELLVLGLQKDYKSGEITFGFGLGANLELPVMGGGGKGQVFVKFDNDLSPVDCGVVLEAGGEATAGPVMIAEEKLTATIGMTSGINLTGVHAGNQVNIFEMNPGK